MIVNDTNFQKEVLDSSLPVVVEFGAEWCVPCKRLEPLMVQIMEEWAGKAVLATVSVDENPELVMQYQVMTVPTLMLFVGGKPVERLGGSQSRTNIIGKFAPHIT